MNPEPRYNAEREGMGHEIWYDVHSETLRIHFSGDVSADDYQRVVSEINRMPADKKTRLLFNVIDVDRSAPLNRDPNNCCSGKIKMVNGHRAAIVDPYPIMRRCGRALLALFTGDYEIRFFTGEEEALLWLKGADNET
jgi:hypothetical protein